MDAKKPIRPGPGERILRIAAARRECEAHLGDIEECRRELRENKGRLFSRIWYWAQIIKALGVFSSTAIGWRITMFREAMKISFRNIRRHKIYSLINMAGLAVGIAGCILVMLYVRDETRYDRFHENRDNIYRVVQTNYDGDQVYESPSAPYVLGPTLASTFPEVKDFTRFHQGYRPRIQIGDRIFRTVHAEVDPAFLNIFSFPLVAGDPEKALSDPRSLVVTESFAEKCFETTDVLERILNFHFEDRKITGVIEDPPAHSHLQFECLVPASSREGLTQEQLWGGWASTYVQAHDRLDLPDFNRRIRDIAGRHLPGSTTQVRLQPLGRVYLHSNFVMEEHEAEERADMIRGDIRNLYVLSFAAFCTLLLACINYTNLCTAMAHRRSREIGVRKVFGSQKRDLVRQFLGESLVLAFLSLFGGFLLVGLILPVFNQISGKSLGMQGLMHSDILLGILLVGLLTGLLSGGYPAFFLASMRSTDVLKGRSGPSERTRFSLRRILVVFQFAVAIAAIIGAVVFTRQMRFIRNQYVGFGVDNTVVVTDWEFSRHHAVVKADLLRHPHVVSVTQSVGPGYNGGATRRVDWEGRDPLNRSVLYRKNIDYDFADVLNAELVAGRFFSEEISTDTSNYVLNQSAVKRMGLRDPVGKRFSFEGREGEIIGVLKDRHFGDLRYPIQPMFFRIHFDHPRFMIKVDEARNILVVLRHVNDIRKKFPKYAPVSYRFIEDDLGPYSIREQRLSRIFTWVTMLALFLACLGLLGLSAYYVDKRSKEIGIRKIVGGSVSGIVLMLTRDFIKWVLIAGIISVPITAIIMNRWLQDFVYKARMGVEIYLLPVAAVLVVAVLTVAAQAIRTALANPAEALRYE